MKKRHLQKLRQFYWTLFPKAQKIQTDVWILWMRVKNIISNKSILSTTSHVTVSLTTHGQRIDMVFITLETIANGMERPGRIILWLNGIAPPPPTLKRLENRGLEIQRCENFGPHTKYYPYVETHADLAVPLVTADDDVLYPRNWLQGLMQSYALNPHQVNCYRARDVVLEKNGMAPYLTWPLSTSTQASFGKMATGVSGVIYPPGLQMRLQQAGRRFMVLCPTADDLWLHLVSIRSGYKIQQIGETSQDFEVMPGSQAQALCVSNQFGGENDRQILQTYEESDFRILRNQKY